MYLQLGEEPAHTAFEIPQGAGAQSEVRVSYPIGAAVRFRLWGPEGELACELLPGERGFIRTVGPVVGRVYHGEHSLHLFLDPDSGFSHGHWEIELELIGGRGGPAYLWMERNQ
jgi:hypothetical protein